MICIFCTLLEFMTNPLIIMFAEGVFVDWLTVVVSWNRSLGSLRPCCLSALFVIDDDTLCFWKERRWL